MPYRTREVVSMLLGKLHFVESEDHSDDHAWYELNLPGLPLIKTKVSRGSKPIPDPVVAAIARQLRVRQPFFRELMSCAYDADEYERRVRSEPYPPWDIRF